jgi:Asp/Glu/hydantoin racemase
MNDREILLSIINAEKEGYDAMVIFCGFDPALQAARQMLEIPVIGIFESSLHFAAMMGRRFGVITCEPAYISQTEENIDKYGMRHNAISNLPVRSTSLSTGECIACSADLSPLLESFKETAMECIKDGAEVMIIGCGVLSTMLTAAGLNNYEGVPVLDPFLVGIKVGELMGDYHRAGFPVICRIGAYNKAPALEIENFLATFFDG